MPTSATDTTVMERHTTYALDKTLDWADIRASLSAVSAQIPSEPASSRTFSTTSSDSKTWPVKSWISGSSLAMYLTPKDAMRATSAPWRGWIPVETLFGRPSADPKQTFNELLQKGLIRAHIISEIHSGVRCCWIVTLNIEDPRVERRSFKAEHRNKKTARGEAIRLFIVAIIKQHIEFEEL